MQTEQSTRISPVQRIRIWYVLLLIVCGIFIIRLFYLQVIKHDQYRSAALTGQLREYEIPAERGVIVAKNGDESLPIVLNEVKYTLFADPQFVEDKTEAAAQVQKIIGGNASDYAELMQADSRYVVLAKKLDKKKKAKIDELELKGIGTREAVYRTYPQGQLAAQLLGFVNDEGTGKYGLEQALNDKLQGKPGRLRAITDANGVPLPANDDNVLIEPEAGERVELTIDIAMQKHLEDILASTLKQVNAETGGAVILDAQTGAVRAMSNYPTYNPTEFFKVSADNVGVFENGVVSSPLEIGSIMKPFTLAAAINEGVVTKDTQYYDPGYFNIDGARVENVEELSGAGPKTVHDILRQSLNTGATWLLTQLGGGEINEKARTTWHDYMTNHYQFGNETGIEQGYESAGSIPHPTEGFGLNIQFANTAFGQGMSATPLQVAAALAGLVNGGTYHSPYLVEKTSDSNGKTTEVGSKQTKENILGKQATSGVRGIMESVFTTNGHAYGMKQPRPQYSIGGKTGSAQISKPEGGYYENRYNGTFMGFVGGNEIEYVIVVRVDEPKVGGYAGSAAAGPVFVNLTNMLIDNFGVTPKR